MKQEHITKAPTVHPKLPVKVINPHPRPVIHHQKHTNIVVEHHDFAKQKLKVKSVHNVTTFNFPDQEIPWAIAVKPGLKTTLLPALKG